MRHSYRCWISFALLATACATSPTGRKQLMFLSDNEMNQMGVASFAQMKQQERRSSDPQINAEVQCVTRQILASLTPAEGGGAGWEVVVFEDPTPNAFALPGKKIGVQSGMLKIAQTPAQLAAVIAHETGHVIARHGNERMSTAFAAQGGLAMADIATQAAMSPEKENQRQLMLAALGVGAQVGVMLPYSRAQESEADEIGLMLMARAGFDPREAIQLWRNMEKMAANQPPEFLSTHPSNGTRIDRLTAKLPDALRIYQAKMANRPTGLCPNRA